jgi:hypothetical protein
METPKIEVRHDPRGPEDDKPYLAVVKGGRWYYAANAATPSEALLLVAAHWHSRPVAQSEEKK